VAGAAGSGGTKAIANPRGLTTKALEVLLDGSTSTSFDGGPLAYQWSVATGSLPAYNLGSNISTSHFELVGGPGTYTFILTVTDSAGTTSTDTVTVTKQ
jgi:hypothetical protein